MLMSWILVREACHVDVDEDADTHLQNVTCPMRACACACVLRDACHVMLRDGCHVMQLLKSFHHAVVIFSGKKALHVAWHPQANAIAVAGLNKLYIYQATVAQLM